MPKSSVCRVVCSLYRGAAAYCCWRRFECCDFGWYLCDVGVILMCGTVVILGELVRSSCLQSLADFRLVMEAFLCFRIILLDGVCSIVDVNSVVVHGRPVTSAASQVHIITGTSVSSGGVIVDLQNAGFFKTRENQWCRHVSAVPPLLIN